ncbi:UvrD-helicase domain-containing protein [Luteibacter aegosomaticola]|nr:UvrD-helicase domain-containing protein [Luteibacter aegosomaticola]UPG92346.1 UvrD-helicase domain-containing protein [Luteibacter aegosomaticola]
MLAGPGSGKTRTIVMKVARLVTEAITEPHRIAVLTYSNACVNEIRRRLSNLRLDDESRVLVSTVHGFCLVELIMPFARLAGVSVPEPLVVATEAQRSRHFGEAVAEVLGRRTDYKFRMRCEVARMAVQDRQSPAWTGDDRVERKVVDAFERRMARAGLIDFDGMVLAGVELIDKHEWVVHR